MADPLVSVVMAAYNGAALIRETIASVLDQTVADFEIVVVDDKSRDDTVAVLDTIRDPRLRVIRAERNGGPAVARTIALSHARGRFIAGLDQDDLCHPERFARQLAYLDAHPEVVLVASTIAMFGTDEARTDPYPDLVDPGQIDWTMLLLNPLAWSTAMMRGEAARALTPFERDDYRFAEDFDLYHRIRAHGRIGRIAEPLVRYRLHAGGASKAFEEGMIASAGRVLADRYAPLLGDRAAEAGALMSRHAGASYPPPDATTLARCGEVIGALLDAHGDLAPGHAPDDASRLWWQIARRGLRAGHYGLATVLRARPAFARPAGALRVSAAADAAIGLARRVGR
jgi:glycosyltransferase involved in cell wall biosynthesis